VFLLVVGLGGLRFAVRALAWMTCVDRPARLAFRDALAAFLAGDALGTLSPLGLLASEPTKVLIATVRLPPNAAVSSVAIENVLYFALCRAVGREWRARVPAVCRRHRFDKGGE
jgi:hypothetical protein